MKEARHRAEIPMLGELSHVAVIVCHDQLHHRGDGENIIVQDVTPWLEVQLVPIK